MLKSKVTKILPKIFSVLIFLLSISGYVNTDKSHYQKPHILIIMIDSSWIKKGDSSKKK